MTVLRKQESKETSFLRSALTIDNPFVTTDEFLDWFKSRNQACLSEVYKIPLSDLEDWYFSDYPHRLVHQSGKFFSIGGVRVKTTFGSVPEWDQPIIIQPEVGILGVITKVVGEMRYFLLQAKMEPGNINSVQLSPTVQATRSNYTCVHKGKLPLYLEYFIKRGKAKILVDQIQSEQGARFFQKVNRNMVVEVEDDIQIYEDFCWLTLGQIKQLLLKDNIVNMDSRSVLSCIPFMSMDLHRSSGASFSPESAHTQIFDQQITGFSKSLLDSMTYKEAACHTLDEIISWYTEMRSKYYLAIEHISLDKVRGWIQTDCDIRQETGQYFSVVGVKVKARGREVDLWSQPLLEPSGHGLVGFLTQKINGVLHFLTCAKMEPGTIGAVEIGPTVACSHATERANGAPPPFLDLFLNVSTENLRYSSIQSEEGGRFYHEQNQYVVVEISPESQIDLKENYIWMTLRQIMDLTKHRYFNVEARNLISCLNFLQWI